MTKHITIILAFLMTICTSVALSETSYVLNTFYINQTNLSHYEKKRYSSTSISTNVGYLYKNIESCRSALKDSFLENTTDPEKDVASNRISDDDAPGYTLTWRNGDLFFFYECTVVGHVNE